MIKLPLFLLFGTLCFCHAKTIALLCKQSSSSIYLYTDGDATTSFRTFGTNCKDVNDKVVGQINKWTKKDNCKNGGEKCLYKVRKHFFDNIKCL